MVVPLLMIVPYAFPLDVEWGLLLMVSRTNRANPYVCIYAVKEVQQVVAKVKLVVLEASI
jgi:hypothetical protein